ncbi:MAG: phosphatidate cytidylyltransferase [Dethiobacter sp.]|jgi:phosphatidate cytidylyltransferase|nr:phosphatidate cytidylyltransferase [Dethiobacter sp.]
MLKQRIISALIIVPLVLALSWFGGWPFFGLVLLAAHLGLRELYNLTGQKGKSVSMPGFAGNFVLLLTLFLGGLNAYFFAFVIYFLLLNCYFVVSYPRDYRHLLLIVFGKIYITTLIGFFLLLRLESGFPALLAVFLAVWASDSGAYFVGMSFGRRQLAPRVSPKKTLEGALGGLLAATILLSLLAPPLGMSRPFAALLGFTLSVAGQFGDLSESALKRWANTKDSGIFLPGHGGVLDRVDSLLFAVPVAFLLINIAVF